MIDDFVFLVPLFLALMAFLFARTIYNNDIKRDRVLNLKCSMKGVGVIIQTEHMSEREIFAGEPGRLEDRWRYELDIIDSNGVRHRIKTDWDCLNLGRAGTRFALCYNPDNISEFVAAKQAPVSVAAWVIFLICIAGVILGLWGGALALFVLNFR